jgi:hypothetical protein
MPVNDFVEGVFSTNDRDGSRKILVEVIEAQNRALYALAKEARKLCQRNHVCSHRLVIGHCYAKDHEDDVLFQCNRNSLDWAVERVMHYAFI